MSQSDNESIRFAGDVNIRRCELVSSSNFRVDVTNQTIGVEIYEDLFSPFNTMAITLRESQDFINALPLRGEEIINLEIATPSFNRDDQFFKGKYYVYKVSDRQLITERSVVYTMYCISYEALMDLNVKHSKAYSGNISEIVKSILLSDGLKTTKQLNIQATVNSTKYVSNFWSPVKNINFLATGALSVNGDASYLFFENRKGFNFVSLESLYNQPVFQKFIKDDYTRDTIENISYRNLNRDYQRILDFKVKVSFDALKFTTTGAYASRIYAYDMVKKKYFAKDYDALTSFAKDQHLNQNPLYTSMKPVSPTNMIFNEIRHYGSHDGFADTSNVLSQQQRYSKLGLIRSSIVEITVFGRTDYTVGQKVYIEVPKPTVITEKDQANTDDSVGFVDAAYSGNYIITAINHVINRDSHNCIIELSKESTIG